MFRTELHPQKPGFQLDISDAVITAGSCFSEVTGRRFQENKFDVLVNPFGTVFHPGVICDLLSMALNGQIPSPDTFVQPEGRWVSYMLHSKISAPDPSTLQKLIKAVFEQVSQYLRKAKVLFLTAGTAFLYEHKNLKSGVANCQKQPQKNFEKKLSTAEELQESFEKLYQNLKKANPYIQIVLTVSPVRHIKDTMELNSLSKSVLRLWCHQVCRQFPDCGYFPGYELLLDDLRDYRFYARDLIHPSGEAEDYIWNKFSEAYLSTKAKNFLKEWQEIKSALSHRPFNPSSEAHQRFIRKTIAKLESFSSVTDVNEELSALKSQLL